MKNQHKLFLIDGVGALLSALSLGLLLPYFNEYIGMPTHLLYLLAGLAVAFALYSLSCYFIKVKSWKPFLRGIAIVNLLYCCFTMYLLFSNFQIMTGWGVAYFIVEIAIIIIVAYWELVTASRDQ